MIEPAVAGTTPTMPDPAWNRTERDYPSTLLPEAFAAQVARTPAATALRFRDQTLTYAELDDRVDRLARHLRMLGVGRDSFVAVCMDRSVEMVIALYAIQRAGGAYVPLDPEYPADRIGFMLDDLDGPILLTQDHLAPRFADGPATVIAIDRPLAPVEAPVTADLPEIRPEDLAYVIYTSGSTGRPKGAMISHGAIANRIYWMQEHLDLTPEDRVLQKTPFSFDVSVWEFFWPLIIGAELVVAEPGGHRDAAYLARTITGHGITTLHFVPSMLQLFLESPGAGECVSLRRVICSGEALPRALQDRFFARLDAELHNLYGPTEAAVDVTYWVCDRESVLPFVPIGRPVANTQMHILDEALEPVPAGEVGDLYIGGVQVGRGYLNRPELSAERFLPDPFRTGGTLYKTGDLARYLPDGNIEFLGRSDFQVKIRGFRVELGEIEAALEAVDGVRGAVVVARTGADAELELVAYIATPSGELSVDELRTRLQERLPDYMVPRRFVSVASFPLTSSGKVDRKALPDPVRDRPQLGTPYVAPRTELQRWMAEQWSIALDIDRVGIDDRFFELGGTSLQAARFINLVQEELGESLSVVELFGAPTIAEFATALEQGHRGAVAMRWGAGGASRTSDRRATTQPEAMGSVTTDDGTLSSADRPAPSPSRDALATMRDRRQAARGRGPG